MTTTAAPPEVCTECGGGGRPAPGQLCPVCRGTGMATAAQAAAYRDRLIEAATAGALERARRLGAAGVDLMAQRAAQARDDAAEFHRRTELAARRAEDALSQVRAASLEEMTARAQHAAVIDNAMLALQPLALPAPQPPNVGPLFAGAARDPVIYADTISARQLDVWGALNLGPGLGSGLMVNPMTSAGQIIYSTGGGTPNALNPGALNQVLTMGAGGLPIWANSAAGFTNPMSAQDDIIIGAAGGTAARLPSSGVVGAMLSLTTPLGHVGWGTGPLTTAGDLLYRDTTGNFLQRLAIGAAGTVLTSNGTGPVWAAGGGGGGGMPNVFTTTGDMVYANPGTTAVRLPIGSLNQILTVGLAGTPVWTSGTTTVINPSGDVTGATDTTNINNANNAFNTANTGGRIVLGPGTFYITAVTISAQTVNGTSGGSGVSLWGTGSSTTIKVVGNGIGISCHRTSGYGAQFGQPADLTTSSLKYFVLDGTLATNGAIGLDWGDGWGYDLDLTVVNFTATNTIAVQEINRVFWTEKAHVKLNLMNNLQPLVITRTSAGDHSHEYNQYELYIFINTDSTGTVMHNGVQVLGGTNWGGDVVFAYGNVSSLPAGWNLAANPIALFSFVGNDGSGDWSRMYAGEFHFKIEQNGGVPSTGNYPYCFYFGSNQNAIKQSTGRIAYTGGSGSSNLNGGEFSFDGPILGDTTLSNLSPGPPGSSTTITGTPAFPGYGVIQQNYGPNQLVSVTGAGVTGVTISGSPTGMSSGTFFVQAGASITVNGAAPNPTVYSWVPAATSTY